MGTPQKSGVLVVLFCLTASISDAQQNLEAALDFEGGKSPAVPSLWVVEPAEGAIRDSVVVHQGRFSVAIRGAGEGRLPYSEIKLTLPRDFTGDTVWLKGWRRAEDVTFAGVHIKQETREGVTLSSAGDNGAPGEWEEFTFAFPVHARARTISIEAFVEGGGTLWLDGLQLLVDDRPLSGAPRYVATPSGHELDREFIRSSGIEAQSLSRRQIESLVLLGKVWGFAKYHHPRLAAGEHNWDFELFRIIPRILSADSREAASARISEWLDHLGTPEECDPCAASPLAPHLPPPIAWIHDRESLGGRLADRLDTIYQRRNSTGQHYYVALYEGDENANLQLEEVYDVGGFSDAGYRLLVLFRYWNIIQYWFPYRDLIDEDWDAVLAESIPRFLAPLDSAAYRAELARLVSRIDDTHALVVQRPGREQHPPHGQATLPIDFRFAEGKPIVTGYLHPDWGPASGLRPGDVITRIDGSPVDSLLAAWRPFHAASNPAGYLRKMEIRLLRGESGPVEVEVERENEGLRTFKASRLLQGQMAVTPAQALQHDLPGDAFRMLTPEVAYLRLSGAVAGEVRRYIERAAQAEVFVLDLRNYPGDFVTFLLGGHFVTRVTPFALSTGGDLSNPGAFSWREAPTMLQPREPHFGGKVVVLVDETTISSAEYHAMAFRANPRAIVVGSMTSGADGNVSSFSLLDGFTTRITGMGIFYPDRSPTQQVGIVPDVVVEPTIAGIRAGRDEVLEAAVSHALGRTFVSATR